MPRADTSTDLPVRFVGHAAGWRKIDEALRSLSSASKRPMLLFAGESGIGKSWLLGMTADKATAAGARVVSARCFEAIVELEWGLGLVARWDGDLVRARDLTTRAVALARVRQERWRELECLLWLAKIDLELQRCDDAIAHCDEAVRLATLIGVAHAPVAKALRVLAERRKPGRGSARGKDSVLVELRDFDDKANLAYFLNGCAAYELERGKTKDAQSLAHKALAAASAVARVTELVVARAALARIAHAVGDSDELARQVAALTSLGDPRRLSARARSQLKLVLTSKTVHDPLESHGSRCSAVAMA